MRNVVIASASRTAIGKFGGSLKDFGPGQLGSVVLKDALKKQRWGAKMGNDEVVDLMIHDGLWDIFNNYHMGVTAGNASGINDGAAAVLLMSEEKAKEKGLSPFATIKSYGFCGVPPEIMGMGPVCATRKAIEGMLERKYGRIDSSIANAGKRICR